MCQEFFVHSGSLSPNRKGKCGKRKTTPRTDQLLLINSRLHPTMTSKDFQRDSGIATDDSTVWCRLLEVGWKAIKPIKKATVDTCYEAETVSMGK